MDYVLTVLTNGRRDCLARTLAAFVEHVEPQPVYGVLVDDGGASASADLPEVPSLDDLLVQTGFFWKTESPMEMVGSCQAMRRCWLAAGETRTEWVFSLEDDFVILRRTDLCDLALVLETKRHLKQMALVRCPWAWEIPFGGYFKQAPWHYTRQSEIMRRSHRQPWRVEYEWVETQRNWANCPALFRTALVHEFGFPVENCENELGRQICERYPDAAFGLWGGGEPWSAHIGVERAKGAHGY